MFTFFVAVTFISAQNQGGISGYIKDKQSLQPIEYATVSLCNKATHKVQTGTVTDSTGFFSIDYNKYGTYELTCSFVGYADSHSLPFTLGKQHATVQIGTILMNENTTALGEIVVEGKRSTYVQTIDKKIFNVGSDVMAGNGAASDLLQNIPSVQVDIDGNVTLRGNENVQILIDGKPSVMMRNTTRGAVLSQIPANSIERIEVITNPSAQYKPDGTSGIINLILKKKQPAGLNGNMIANIGNNDRYNGGVSLGYTLPKLSISANYNYRHDRRDRYTDDNRTVTDGTSGNHTYITQHIDSKAPSRSHIGGLGVVWNPTFADRFEASGSFNRLAFPRVEDNRLIQRSETSTTTDYNRHRNDNETQKTTEAAAAYTHTFNKDNALTIDYTHSRFSEVENNHYSNIYSIPSTQSTTLDNTLIRQKYYENLIRAIYTNQLNKQNKLVLGYESELDKSDMRYFAEDFLNNKWIQNSNKSNDFLFHENVHSLYGTLEHNFNNLTVMAGVRAEQSFITSSLLTLDQKVKNNYFLFYPTLHSSYNLNNNNELQFNYSLRVNRPEGEDMNPFPEYQDPYNIRAGNPYLKPEKIHSIEVGWQYKKNATTFILTPYYRYIFNKMTEITQILDNGVMKTTKENMSSNNSAGTELILNSAIGRWCNFNINSNLYWNVIDASNLGYSNNRNAFSWYLAANANFIPAKNLMFQINTHYKASELTTQGTIGSTYIINVGTRYDIPKYNLTCTATISDLFDSFKNTLDIHTSTIDRHLIRKRQPRIFYFGISYHFGNRSKKRNQELKYDEAL